MKNGTLPHEEEIRLEALYSYEILDSEADRDFDEIASLASQLCNTPIALITFIDKDRQWFKSKKGIGYAETSRDVSFCSHAILENEVMHIHDTLQDDRFFDNPYVTGNPWIRFYAGMPLIIKSGQKLGTLCVLDRRPKQLNENQISQLRILANQVVKLLELRLLNLQLKKQVTTKTSELSRVFDRIQEGFITLDNNWCVTYANRQLGDIAKRDPQSLLGKNIWEEFPEAMDSATYHAFHLAKKENKYVCHIDFFEPLNLWQENHIYPTQDGLSIFVRDITDRKQSEKKLIESLETLERAEEHAKMGSWHFNIHTGERFWSKQLLLMFGFESTDKAPESEVFLERIHPEDRNLILASIEKMKQGIKAEEMIIRTNPAVMPLRYILGYSRAASDSSGKIIRFEGSMIDITTLQKTNQELDRFVYSVSHDLRAPLTTILGLINLVEIEYPETTLLNYFNTIRDHVNRLDSFIQEILDYSMNTRTELKKDKIDFSQVIEQVQQRIKPLLQSDRVQLNLTIRNEQNADFYSDKGRLEIILNNLYSNSIKYQDFTKDACEIKIHISITQQKAILSFADNGIGVQPQYLDKIFNMFYRASDRAKGSGLGLYIVKETINKLGGSIQVQSEFGKQTTFTIMLPNLLTAS